MITGPRVGSEHNVTIREDAPRVLVVGGGFGGLAAVAGLARSGYRVTLADRHIYATFQPLLYQVATAGLAPSDVAYPLRGFAHKQRARFRHGDLSGIDPAARIAEFSDGGRVGYDYLILATGVAAAFFGITGAAQHSYGLYTLHDAVSLRERIMAGLERLSIATNRDEVTVTIVGGGATGVELAGTLADLRNLALPASYPDLDPGCVHIRLVEMAPGVLGPFEPKLREYAAQQLRARGVDLRLNATIKEITAQSIILDNGEVLRSDLTAWAAGISGPARPGSGACRRAAAAAWSPARTCGCRTRTGSSRSATSRSSTAPRCPSSPSLPCRWGGMRRRRSAAWRPGRRRSRSATTTRASWPPSAAGRRWCS